MPFTGDVYAEPKAMGIYREIGPHEFLDVNAGTIVQRIMMNKERYLERQRAKRAKAELEAEQRQRELEQEAQQ